MPKTARQLCQLLGGKTRGEAIARAKAPDHLMGFLTTREQVQAGSTVDQATMDRLSTYQEIGMPEYAIQVGSDVP